MKRGTLLALIAAGFAGWWLGRQAPDVARQARPQSLARPESTARAATPAAPVTETTVAAPSPTEDAEAPEPPPASGSADAGRAMREARSTIDQRMRALRSRPSKSA
ncbi:MAG TPA: hypothetical protein VNM43_02945 [Dehalococcoidia bacterium]|nr:hypothetical protein [Dehalococcoidia bacterium]